MAFHILAPWPQVETGITLPAPAFGDTSGAVAAVDLKRGMEGTTYTYIQSSTRRRLRFEFTLAKMKAFELREFYRAYHQAGVRIVNHNGDIWEGRFISDPFAVASIGGADGWPGGESVSTILEFEATLLTAGEHSAC